MDTTPEASVSELVGSSASMRALRARIAATAGARSTVLLTGETGTGKGLVARLLHRLSGRTVHPFVHVDCGALAGSVIESELFGHERGAFTGAAGRRAGRFELAGRGTLFLDEVGELPPELQAKLLRVLHDREYERVGGSRSLRMEARVVAATSRNLEQAVRKRRFRPDLYFRLAVVTLHVPSLRERPEDLPELIRAGLTRLAAQLELAVPEVHPGSVERLREHVWPGNVRELFNLLERFLVEGRGRPLDPTALDIHRAAPAVELGPPTASEGNDPAAGGDPAGTERERIGRVLVETGGNVARAARRLGLPRSTLRHRIERHRLRHLLPRD